MPTFIEADDLTIKHGVFGADIRSDAITKVAEGFAGMSVTRHQPDVSVNDVTQTPEAIEFHFEKPVRVRERSGQAGEDHRLKDR